MRPQSLPAHMACRLLQPAVATAGWSRRSLPVRRRRL